MKVVPYQRGDTRGQRYFYEPFAALPVVAYGLNGDVARGEILFVKYCTGCHGPEGGGDGYKFLHGPDPANLTSPATRKKSDADLLKTIHEGKPNMPPWNVRLSEKEGRDVLAYVRALAK